MICPSCNGEKKIFIPFAHKTLKTGEPVFIDCQSCNMTGVVDDRHPQWKIEGDKLKDARIDRRETLRNFCKRTGVDPVLRSMQERGFADPIGVEP